jgi:hypothetical protein
MNTSEVRNEVVADVVGRVIFTATAIDGRRFTDERLLFWISECERLGATQTVFHKSLLAELERRTT